MSQVEGTGSGAVHERAPHVGEDWKRPWWRRGTTLWLLAAVLILPFGWILPVAQVAWIRVKSRRSRKR